MNCRHDCKSLSDVRGPHECRFCTTECSLCTFQLKPWILIPYICLTWFICSRRVFLLFLSTDLFPGSQIILPDPVVHHTCALSQQLAAWDRIYQERKYNLTKCPFHSDLAKGKTIQCEYSSADIEVGKCGTNSCSILQQPRKRLFQVAQFEWFVS